MLLKPGAVKKILSISMLIFFVTVIGCSRGTNQAVIKEGGETENNKITRIISAAPSITEIIAGLGLAGKLVAVDKYSKDVEGVKADLPEIDFFNPDIEAIAGMKPDIIISGEINTNGREAAPYRFFTQLGVHVVEIPTSNSINDIYHDIMTIAQSLGVAEKGEELVREMRGQIEIIASRVRSKTNAANSASETKTVYFEIAPAPNTVSFGRETYLNELIEIIGAQNIFAAEKRWFTPGPEAVISANPDIIFILSGISNSEEVKNRPGFRYVNAVRQNNVYVIDANRASRPSQNIALALEEMYKAVWGE